MKTSLYDESVYKINLLFKKYSFLFYNILIPLNGTVLEQTDEKRISLLSFMFPANDHGITETIVKIEIRTKDLTITEWVGVDKINDIEIKKIFHLMDSLFDTIKKYRTLCNDYYKNKKVYLKLYEEYFTIKYVDPQTDDICVYKNYNSDVTMSVPSYETNIREL